MQNAIRAKQRRSNRAKLRKAAGLAPDSDGQIPVSGSSTERVRDPGMSSQIPRIAEYQNMARRKLGPPVPNVVPIAPEESHSPTSPSGSYDLFSFSPPHQTSHVSSIPLSIVYEPKPADGSPHTIRISRIDTRRSNHSIRRHKQRARWHKDILPKLIRPYMAWVRQRATSNSLGVLSSGTPLIPIPDAANIPCSCQNPHTVLNVTCVYMDRLEEIKVQHCLKRPAAVQLLELGLFPCAPVRPGLAVSLVMLEWACTLFLHMASNVQAWADTVEIMLKRQGYSFRKSHSFRRRFNNALVHYQMLIRLVEAEMTRMTNGVHPSASSDEAATGTTAAGITPTLDELTPIDARQYCNARDPPNFSAPDLPSDYLRSRCPCCFGGSAAAVSGLQVDCIVSLDANFQLKRIRDYDQRAAFRGQKLPGFQDPKMTSPLTIEVPRCYAEEWKCKLEEMRSGPKKRKRDETEQHEPGGAAEGQIISGLKVVASVYDACKDSFVAADEQREKVSKKYFEDTGLMASVCRHGIPLFHVSLWTPGEQQFYAFALLSMLLEHLPDSWKVGCLYDIGCQIHRAVHKWDFASEWRERLRWGVSIFHAYGHQWACQLWYHPCKDELWGLSDGEGCERFWSELRHLISGLRVTGYHRRLFVLDMQIEHITTKKHFQLPRWLKEHL